MYRLKLEYHRAHRIDTWWPVGVSKTLQKAANDTVCYVSEPIDKHTLWNILKVAPEPLLFAIGVVQTNLFVSNANDVM